MAKISDLEKGNCLVWDTEGPRFWDVPRKSSNFSLQGCEWNFEMGLYLSSEWRYSIELHKVTDEEPVERVFTISTFVSSDCGRDWPCSVKTVRSAPQEIWSCPDTLQPLDRESVGSNHHGKWRIFFYIDAPFTLPHAESETHPNSSDDKCVQASTLDISPDLESLSHDFGRLLVNEKFPDVQLRCGDRSFRAHRSILASRSYVFGAMFHNKMAESETDIVDVTDMDADVFDLLLKYVYSGKLPVYSDVTASSLYVAGKKYSIDALKKTCSDRMVGGLTEKNCLGFLRLAEYDIDGFKDRVVSFVAENLEALEKQAWSEFRNYHSDLALSVCERRLASILSNQA